MTKLAHFLHHRMPVYYHHACRPFQLHRTFRIRFRLLLPLPLKSMNHLHRPFVLSLPCRSRASKTALSHGIDMSPTHCLRLPSLAARTTPCSTSLTPSTLLTLNQGSASLDLYQAHPSLISSTLVLCSTFSCFSLFVWSTPFPTLFSSSTQPKS